MQKSFKDINKKALEIKTLYDQLNKKERGKTWSSPEYLQGLMTDLGELSEFIMARNNYRAGEDLDEKIKHELCDCLWSVLVLADSLQVDLEEEFPKQMNKLKLRF